MFLHGSWLWVKTREVGAEKNPRMRIPVAGVLGWMAAWSKRWWHPVPFNTVLLIKEPSAGEERSLVADIGLFRSLLFF